MVPMDVDAIDEQPLDDFSEADQESRFFTCHVCGDNWFSLKQLVPDGSAHLTYVHQMGMEPTLKRIAQMSTPLLISEHAVERWDYFLGEDVVDEQAWREELDRRRFVLRSICTN